MFWERCSPTLSTACFWPVAALRLNIENACSDHERTNQMDISTLTLSFHSYNIDDQHKLAAWLLRLAINKPTPTSLSKSTQCSIKNRPPTNATSTTSITRPLPSLSTSNPPIASLCVNGPTTSSTQSKISTSPSLSLVFNTLIASCLVS